MPEPSAEAREQAERVADECSHALATENNGKMYDWTTIAVACVPCIARALDEREQAGIDAQGEAQELGAKLAEAERTIRNNVVACVNCKRPVDVTALNAIRCDQCSPGAAPVATQTAEAMPDTWRATAREMMGRILVPGCPHAERPIVAIEPPYLFEGPCRACLVERGAKAIEQFAVDSRATARKVVEAFHDFVEGVNWEMEDLNCSAVDARIQYARALLARPEVQRWAG